MLYISTFLIATGEAIYRPVRFASIPDIVQKKNLTKVNGLEQTVVGMTLVVGSLLGGMTAFFNRCYHAVLATRSFPLTRRSLGYTSNEA
ncbi:hypothetical protein JCM19045_644 [Bacillus sp. JCM 19045]|nr:hypothetical protein JCM19045_644 [Bacillus sp. JCM 19045]